MIASTPSPTLHADIIFPPARPTFYNSTHNGSPRFQNKTSPYQLIKSPSTSSLSRKFHCSPTGLSSVGKPDSAKPAERSAAVKTFVDVGTQYSPPQATARHLGDQSSSSSLGKRRGMSLSPRAPPEPALEPQPTVKPTAPPSAFSQPATASSITLATPSSASSSSLGSSPKRLRQASGAVVMMPEQYETCDVKDLVVLISNMLMELIRFNDDIPLKDGRLTRFHSRAPPGISVQDYLQRLATHATLSPPILLSMVYYIDRLCALYPAFTISSLTVHRFLITSATVASKGLSDSFWTNNTYARVGGVSLKELALLELEFLWRVEWRIVPKPEVLADYYRSLVERSEGYQIEEKKRDVDMNTADISADNLKESNDNISRSKTPQ